eukprot:scaffold13393_cov260-Alexandrium_tamarense.AAC.3
MATPSVSAMMLRAFARVSDWDCRASVLDRRRSLEPLLRPREFLPPDSMSELRPKEFRSTFDLAAS